MFFEEIGIWMIYFVMVFVIVYFGVMSVLIGL